jgi:hypothetical protein
LLAAVLLVLLAGHRMNAESSIERFEHYDSGPTSNDLLQSLIADNSTTALGDQSAAPNDPIVAQHPDEFGSEANCA